MFFTLLHKYLLARALRPRRVLVVEDDEMLKPILARVLYSIEDGLDLRWVTRLKEAKQALSERQYDLVIADVFLTGPGTGIELREFCAKTFPEMPVLILSGVSRQTLERTMATSIAPEKFLAKPVTPREYKERIRSIIRSERIG